MNLLVVGNGFDLAHNLPTKYSDFLDFMALCIKRFYPNYINWGRHFDSDDNKYKFDSFSIAEILSSLQSNPNDKVLEIFNNCNKDSFKEHLMIETKTPFVYNPLLRYLICIYAYKKKLNSNFQWIDIEDEIDKLLMQIESSKISYSREFLLFVNTPFIMYDEYHLEQFYFPELSNAIRKNKSIPEDKFKSEIFKLLFKDLEQFNLLLKFYLKLVQDTFHKENNRFFNINTECDDTIKIDYVLSFNYTDISTIYLSEAQKSNVYYINGNLEKNSKIILGIENPNANKTIEFCNDNINLFFKDVQRVLYDMKYFYSRILQVGKNSNSGINLHIIGHSLAFSDKFILLDIIEKADIVTIYYYSYEDMQNKITSLYKLLGNEKFFKYVNNPTGKPLVLLVPQKEILINGK